MAITKLSDVTTANIKTWFGISVADTGKDALIAQALPGCCAQIINYCRHDFESKSRSETLRVNNVRDSIYTKYRPLTSAAVSVVEDGDTLVENTDYVVDRDLGKISKWDDAVWAETPAAIAITYTGGVSLVEAADVLMVLYELVGVTCGIKTRTYVDGEGVEKSVSINSLSDNFIDILERWKQWRV